MRYARLTGTRGIGILTALTLPVLFTAGCGDINKRERTMTSYGVSGTANPGGDSRVGEAGTASSGGSGISDTRGTITSGARADAAAPNSGETGNLDTSARGGRPDSVR